MVSYGKACPNIRRYFRVCNCLIPHRYAEYMRVLYDALLPWRIQSEFNKRLLFNLEDQDYFALTLKNY